MICKTEDLLLPFLSSKNSNFKFEVTIFVVYVLGIFFIHKGEAFPKNFVSFSDGNKGSRIDRMNQFFHRSDFLLRYSR